MIIRNYSISTSKHCSIRLKKEKKVGATIGMNKRRLMDGGKGWDTRKSVSILNRSMISKGTMADWKRGPDPRLFPIQRFPFNHSLAGPNAASASLITD